MVLFFPLLLKAQNYTITYKVYLNNMKDTGVLHIDRKTGSFYSEKSEYDEPHTTRTEQSTGENETMTYVHTTFGSKKKSYQIYPVSGDTLINVAFIGSGDQQVRYYEKFIKMKWEIKDSTKTLSGLVCQKATTNFRGRKYIAWFTPQIPIKVGPWKFNNLPGAILQAYDESKAYSWNAKKITRDAEPENIPDFKNLEKLSHKEYVKKNKQLQKEEEAARIKRRLIRKYGPDANIHLDIDDIDISISGGREIIPKRPTN